MIIMPVIIEDKPKEQIAMLQADSSVLSVKGGDGVITLHVKQNPRETRLVEHVFQVVKNYEETTNLPGDYIDYATMSDGSVRHIFGSPMPTSRRGEFCYINALTEEIAARS